MDESYQHFILQSARSHVQKCLILFMLLQKGLTPPHTKKKEGVTLAGFISSSCLREFKVETWEMQEQEQNLSRYTDSSAGSLTRGFLAPCFGCLLDQEGWTLTKYTPR